MVGNFYALLEQIGYSHPLHPVLTHIPMGMIIGMVVFSFLGFIWKEKNFGQTAYYCLVFALVSIPVVISAGILDWLHYQEGEWNTYIIIKLVFAAVLTILLIFAVILKKKGTMPGKMFLIYFLCFICAGVLGYCGGTLVYG